MVKMEIELATKCRSCFSEEQQMHYLFGEFDQGLSLSDILKSTTDFVVEENDGLSPYFCENCTNIVIDFYNFKSVYQENEKYAKSLFKEESLGSIILVNTVSDDNQTNDEENRELEIVSDNEYNRCADIKEKNDTDKVRKESNEDAEVNEVHEHCSLESDFEDKEIVITAGFIKPQDILKHQMLVDENDSEYANEKVLIIDSIKYSCEECGDCFLLKSGFQQHMLLKHKISIFEFEKYTSRTAIKIPKVSKDIKDENIILQCHICKEEFKSFSEIEEHYKTHKKYICEHCGTGFTKKSYLNDHSEIHTTEKRHVCPMCGKAFRRRTVLVKHKKIHTHPRQCVCEICGLRFNDKGTLKTHIKLKHTKERNFYCTLCGLWFPLKSTLDKHIYRHTENRGKEFICSICHMAYKDKSSLNRHAIVKHTENVKKPSCSFCGKQYTTNTNLLKHIRKHHNSLEVKKDPLSD